MTLNGKEWPILIVSGMLAAENDEGLRLREIASRLEKEKGFEVLRSFCYKDAWGIFNSHKDLSCVLVDWSKKTEHLEGQENAIALMEHIRRNNKQIPVILLTDCLTVQDLPENILELINDCIWLNADTAEFLTGRIAVRAESYLETVCPSFFGNLVQYAKKYKYAWHTPGHMGGVGFLRSPAGNALFKFYGENTLRSDLSISVPELGSLLDHSGLVGEAERNSARVFGADQTYYVLNGTSTINQIIWDSQLIEDDIALVDRNCHKSLNYAMVHTKAFPVYLTPRRNHLGIIGPVRLSEFTDKVIRNKIQESPLISNEQKQDPVRMMALTNSTYDGLCYNINKIKKTLSKCVERIHFDEAWYAYAHFYSLYEGYYGMAPEEKTEDDPPIFCGHSTHKLLTAFSQSSMLHVRNGSKIKINADQFNEAYMMHGSTSPQYSMIASLDVATKMMEDNGSSMFHDIVCGAIELRKKITSIATEHKKQGDWFFDLWQPDVVLIEGQSEPFCQVPTTYLAEHQECWVLSKNNDWHNFEDIEDDYIMLDPIKLTLTTPGVDKNGKMETRGIPACVISNYLTNYNIVSEKTDYYSFLLLHSLGTDQSKQGALLTALYRFKEDYDNNRSLAEVFPKLVASYPQVYNGVGLADHCQAMHQYICDYQMLDQMEHAYQFLPEQAMRPADAYKHLVKGKVKNIELKDVMGCVQAVMLVPYPPGIPIMMGGEKWNQNSESILNYLLLRQEFENHFPGYEGDIHGVEREEKDGKIIFKTMCLT